MLTGRAVITRPLANHFLFDGGAALETVTAGAVVDQQFMGEIARRAI